MKKFDNGDIVLKGKIAENFIRDLFNTDNKQYEIKEIEYENYTDELGNTHYLHVPLEISNRNEKKNL